VLESACPRIRFLYLDASELPLDLGLKDKVAVVTGGSRGIGRAIALALAGEGCHLAICARGEDALRRTEAEIRERGARVFAAPVDLTREGVIDSFIDEAASRLGRLDILVNNAGGTGQGETDGEVWRGTFDLNVLAAVRASDAAVPHMRRQGGGSIIHITSIYGRESGGNAAYNAMKSAMNSHAKSLAVQLAPEGIRVNAVAPGSVRHPGGSWDRRVQQDPEGMKRFVEQNIPSGRFGTAEEIADVVVFLASDRARWVTGACLNVDGGQSRSNI
jgi:3-oxoacyl-[acyl-carrier protein] reductase